jgi:hypothetical protein
VERHICERISCYSYRYMSHMLWKQKEGKSFK